jgi:hypothetical protein
MKVGSEKHHKVLRLRLHFVSIVSLPEVSQTGVLQNGILAHIMYQNKTPKDKSYLSLLYMEQMLSKSLQYVSVCSVYVRKDVL